MHWWLSAIVYGIAALIVVLVTGVQLKRTRATPFEHRDTAATR